MGIPRFGRTGEKGFMLQGGGALNLCGVRSCKAKSFGGVVGGELGGEWE